MEPVSALSDPHGSPLDHILAAPDPGAVAFICEEYYRPGAPSLSLIAVHVPDSHHHWVVVTDRLAEVRTWLAGHALDRTSLGQLATLLGVPVLDLRAAWRLQPVCIPKPWGQEIWYTGIEQRGQSGVGDSQACLPLPWVLALSPDALLMTGKREPALLKILDPLAEEVYGDLYFELHEEKREVYVVTHVDRDTWPDGVGAIRFGFDQDVRKAFPSDEDFRRAYLAAVRDYESVRRVIDERCDALREAAGIGLNEPVAADTLKSWLATLPEELVAREREARAAMNRFTHMLPLRVGDVVKVPCLTPHALQHGVRTVEFQTPVYERQILSFAQKVLTQSHWDTARAVGLMSLGAGALEPLELLLDDDSLRLERIVRFSDFEVLRLTLRADARWTLPEADHYRLLMVVAGSPEVGDQRCEPEDALLVPRCALTPSIAAREGHEAVVLICLPTLADSP
ncbi:MAG TPA: hypothetical protein VIK82_11230 [Porticoccaceae bacterium]